MNSILPPASAIPDLHVFGRQAVQSALARCADDPHVPYLAVVDGTCGNGHDTVFLAETLLSISHKAYGIFAFDVQQAAIDAARARVETRKLTDCVCLLLKNHACLTEELARPEIYPPSLAGICPQGRQEKQAKGMDAPASLCIAAAMYNLGFLPRSNRRLTTMPADTLASLQSAASALLPQGILAVHAYGGHAGGLAELNAVKDWYDALPFSEWRAVSYALCNKTNNPEALFLAEKNKASSRIF